MLEETCSRFFEGSWPMGTGRRLLGGRFRRR